jgi:hypothetical protein
MLNELSEENEEILDDIEADERRKEKRLKALQLFN